MGREVGGGIGMGKTCEPKAFSFQCMTKFTTKKKKKKTPIGFLMTLENIYWSKFFLIEYILKASFYEN